jgi:hypothetical protein
MLATILGSVSTQESEHKAERQRRAARQLAESGQPKWKRAFGYLGDTRQPDPHTAPLVAQAYKEIIGGASLGTICKLWNDAEAFTINGKKWTHPQVSAFLRTDPVSGGTVVYEQIVAGQNYLTRGSVQPRAPRSEYPHADRDPILKAANVSGFGAVVSIADEEAIRTDPALVRERIDALANSLVKQIDDYAIAQVEAALTDANIVGIDGHDWSSAITRGPAASLTVGTALPAADLAHPPCRGQSVRKRRAGSHLIIRRVDASAAVHRTCGSAI